MSELTNQELDKARQTIQELEVHNDRLTKLVHQGDTLAVELDQTKRDLAGAMGLLRAMLAPQNALSEALIRGLAKRTIERYAADIREDT